MKQLIRLSEGDQLPPEGANASTSNREVLGLRGQRTPRTTYSWHLVHGEVNPTFELRSQRTHVGLYTKCQVPTRSECPSPLEGYI